MIWQFVFVAYDNTHTPHPQKCVTNALVFDLCKSKPSEKKLVQEIAALSILIPLLANGCDLFLITRINRAETNH